METDGILFITPVVNYMKPSLYLGSPLPGIISRTSLSLRKQRRFFVPPFFRGDTAKPRGVYNSTYKTRPPCHFVKIFNHLSNNKEAD